MINLCLFLPPGSTFLIWFGPTPRLAVADPDLIREILVSRADQFDRYESHPMVRQLEGEGLVSLRGDKWAHRRRVLTPAFHMENLKVRQSQPASLCLRNDPLAVVNSY
jgi:PHYB activation tagged suppressor 1